MQIITVALDGSGNFTSIQEAIDSVRVHPLTPVEIHVKNGVYKEKVVIPDNKPDISLIGEHKEQTILSFDDFAHMKDEHGKPYGTFRTPTLTLSADRFALKNITIENSAGYAYKGQALALYTSGDRITLENCRFLGRQDTIYTARGRQWFKDCYIEGHVDYIFGSGTAFFETCEIHSAREGYITAASTPEHESAGLIFDRCSLTGTAPAQSVYLGRPWRPYGHTVFINCWMGEHIKSEGWHNWRNPENEQTARYAEYGSSGPGANHTNRVTWSRQLTKEEAISLSSRSVLSGKDNWNPANL